MNACSHRLRVLGLFIVLLLCAAPSVQAAPGDLDPSFDADGKVTTDFFGSYDRASAVAVDTENRIVVAGQTLAHETGYDFALARYNPDGSLDASFDGDGKANIDVAGCCDDAYALAIDSAGKIVVAGRIYNGASLAFALVRLNTDGSLDSSFGDGGKVITDVGGQSDEIHAITLDPAGRIVAAGFTANEPNRDFAVARYNPDGSLDPTFAGDGVAQTEFRGIDTAHGVAIDRRGRIVVVGESRRGPNRAPTYAIARYTPTGAPDSSFDADGILTTGFDGPYGPGATAHAVVLDAKDRIVAAGYAGGACALARYKPGGALDLTFDGDGKTTTTIQFFSVGRAVAIDNAERIVVAGYTQQDFALARFQSDGALDTTFGDGGALTTDFAEADTDQGYAVAIDHAGHIIVAGWTLGPSDFAVARYLDGDQPSTETAGVTAAASTPQ